jgi:hypothetical protein
MEQFLRTLAEKGYSYKLKDGACIVTHDGWVLLNELTVIPESVTFKNDGWLYLNGLTALAESITFQNNGGVYLNNLTTVHESARFKNDGWVELNGVTTSPKNVTFENRGVVYLNALTDLHESVTFKNDGWVYLNGLTTSPENFTFENDDGVSLNALTALHETTKFENGGGVYLSALTANTINYKGQELNIEQVDGSTMIVHSEKKVGEATVASASYFGGGELKELRKCFIAKKDGYSAHGESIKEALSDLTFKIAQVDFDVDELVEIIKEKKSVTVSEYRLLTGACSIGVQEFLDERGLQEKDTLPLSEVSKITKGHYGSEVISDLFNTTED